MGVVVAVGRNANNKKMVFMFTEPEHYWISGNGARINIKHLETSHINNIIFAFKRGKINSNYLGGKEKWLTLLTKELKRRKK